MQSGGCFLPVDLTPNLASKALASLLQRSRSRGVGNKPIRVKFLCCMRVGWMRGIYMLVCDNSLSPSHLNLANTNELQLYITISEDHRVNEWFLCPDTFSHGNRRAFV